MWQQTYLPIAGHLYGSALIAALPIFALVFALAIKRMAAWKASLLGLLAEAKASRQNKLTILCTIDLMGYAQSSGGGAD